MLENLSETNEELELTTTEPEGIAEVENAVDETVIEGEPSETTAEDDSDLPEEVFYQYKGREVSAKEIEKWESGHLMQSDYTKKTQLHSEDVKAFKAERESFQDKIDILDTMQGEIESLILGDLNEANLDELLEDDPAEYTRIKAKRDKRLASIRELGAKRDKLKSEMYQKDYASLHNALEWDNEDKKQEDLNVISAYAKDKGITQEEFNQVTNPKIMAALVDAGKYQKLKSDNPAVRKKVVTPIKSAKPKAATETPKALSLAERMYGKK